MKALCTLIIATSLSMSAFAGTSTYSGKSSKMVQPVAPNDDCTCFGPGWAFGAFGGALFPSHNGNAVGGGGVLGEYFFTENIGFQGDYGVYATHSQHHQFDGDLIVRFPIKTCCIAPYLMAGGGFSTNAQQQGDFNAGAGIEARFRSFHCMGVFIDGAYHFHGSNTDRDFTVARLGVKFPF